MSGIRAKVCGASFESRSLRTLRIQTKRVRTAMVYWISYLNQSDVVDVSLPPSASSFFIRPEC